MRAGAGLTATLHRPSTLQPCVLCSLRCHKTRPPPIPKVLYRGAKSRTTLQLTDLPQNVIRSEKLVKLKENEGPVYPTVLRQVRSNMQKFENCVILTRVGGFYEVRLIWPFIRAHLDKDIALLRARRRIWTTSQPQSSPEAHPSGSSVHGQSPLTRAWILKADGFLVGLSLLPT